MYNKALNCRFKHTGRQGRSKNRIGFPRHIINRYEGTHLPMKKTYSGWDDWHGPWINYNHVIGLINKFVNKPYSKFLKVWHAKLKLASEHIRQTYSLRRIIDMEKVRHKVYSIEFYVDKNDIIRRYEQIARPRRRSQLTKYQRKYNDNVKIPYLGVCKSEYTSYEFLRGHSKTNPILLGDFYVALEGNVVKVPVYTCCAQLMIDYYHSSNLAKFIEDRDLKFEEKKRRIIETWIRIVTHPYFGNSITLNLEGQHIFKEIPNPERADFIRQLYTAGNVEKENELKDLIAKTPKTKTIDIGYGKFYLFIKRADYEKQLKILHKT